MVLLEIQILWELYLFFLSFEPLKGVLVGTCLPFTCRGRFGLIYATMSFLKQKRAYLIMYFTRDHRRYNDYAPPQMNGYDGSLFAYE